MIPVPEDMIPDELFPMFGEGLGIEGAHAFRKKNEKGIYVALCGEETNVLRIGSRGNLCDCCVQFMSEIEDLREKLRELIEGKERK